MEDIQNRIALIISTKGMTNAEFAEAINVQPSNISHIMSGRNKPSLDLVMKILKKFPEVRTEWLLNGRGAMNKESNLFDFTDDKQDKPAVVQASQKDEQVFKPGAKQYGAPAGGKSEKDEKTGIANKNASDKNEQEYAGDADLVNRTDPEGKMHSGKRIERIVVFYTDQTFKTYLPSADNTR